MLRSLSSILEELEHAALSLERIVATYPHVMKGGLCRGACAADRPAGALLVPGIPPMVPPRQAAGNSAGRAAPARCGHYPGEPHDWRCRELERAAARLRAAVVARSLR